MEEYVMKLKVNRKLRIGLIICTIVILAASSFFLLIEIFVKKTQELKLPTYGYISKNIVTYNVMLKPNILYDSNILEENQTYINEYVDYIKANFSYEFTGDKDAEFTGNYELNAIIEGYTSTASNEDTKIIWRKVFPIEPAKQVSETGKDFTIDKDIIIKPHEFDLFVDQIIESSKVNTSARLRVELMINLEIDTRYGKITETHSPTLIIPLGQNLFEIIKSGIGESSNTLTETRIIEVLPNTTFIVLLGVIIVLSLVGLLFLIFFTEAVEKNPLVVLVDKIFRRHGGRMAALRKSINRNMAVKNIYVRSIDDLVRISDELEKPIMYVYSPYPENITDFFIYTPTEMFIYTLKDIENKESLPLVFEQI